MANAVYRTLLATTVIVLVVAGHLGATLTHGEGYLTEHAPAPIRGLARAAVRRHRFRGTSGAAGSSAGLCDRGAADSESRCVKCHGAAKAEGKLRLDSPDAIRKGGEDGAVIVAGHAAQSEIVRRIWLPPSHKDAMPPGGSQPLPASDAALIRWWIDQGARFDQKLSDLDITPDVRPAIEAVVGPIERGGPTLPAVNVAAADRQAVAAATRLGVSVVPLASDVHFIELLCTNAGARFGDRELAALRPLAPQTVWLDLSGTGITDAGLATVAQFKNLTRLHLNRTRISDAGLKQLVGLQQLEYLNLYGTGVTDASIESLRAQEAAHVVCVADRSHRRRSRAPAIGVAAARRRSRPGVVIGANAVGSRTDAIGHTVTDKRGFNSDLEFLPFAATDRRGSKLSRMDTDRHGFQICLPLTATSAG